MIPRAVAEPGRRGRPQPSAPDEKAATIFAFNLLRLAGAAGRRSRGKALEQARTIERRSTWNFVITDTGWIWTLTRPDGSEERSPRTFTTLQACADDAVGRGYGTWKGEERRQVDSHFSGT
jgi:hypothetical protein